MQRVGVVRVLVVEDEDTTRLMLERRLTWAGYRVRAADSADDATAAVDGAFTPDVVVTDMFMPGGSGLSLANALRADPGCAELPMLFLSGRALPGGVSAGRSLGATYLAKPCALADLAQAIDAAAGTTTDELEDVVRRRLGDVAGVEEGAERAPRTADAAALEAAAHRLGGGAATLGADALAAACRSLEERGRDGDVDVADAVQVLADQLARTVQVFAGLAEELEEDVLVQDEDPPAS